MRILLDQAFHDHRNKGNNALLEAALNRLRTFWPMASFDVISISPHFCKIYFPGTNPVNPHNLHQVESKFDLLHKVMPKFLWHFLFELREALYFRTGLLFKSDNIRLSVLSWFRKNDRDQNLEIDFSNATVPVPNPTDTFQGSPEFISNLKGYDFYITTGGGYMCDSDKEILPELFERIETAVSLSIPVFMVSQGVGPMADLELIARAKQVLPIVDYIFYRNQRFGQPLLNSLGVSPDHMMMTGDDALEMAYNARPETPGDGIGISLRVAPYTQISTHQLENVRHILHRIAQEHSTRLIAVAISSAYHEADITHIKYVTDGYRNSLVGWKKLDTPLDAIRKAGQCRLMVSGTYHGAIFALAQGIPVVGVANSVEYYNKLSELSDEFGSGCQVILLEGDKHFEKFAIAIEDAWRSSDTIRPSLLDAAARLIELQHSAYRRIYKLVESKKYLQFHL